MMQNLTKIVGSPSSFGEAVGEHGWAKSQRMAGIANRYAMEQL